MIQSDQNIAKETTKEDIRNQSSQISPTIDKLPPKGCARNFHIKAQHITSFSTEHAYTLSSSVRFINAREFPPTQKPSYRLIGVLVLR
jgi:hypothetical protein